MRQKGFTLLEIMLAISILGMVVAMVSLSLSGTFKVIEATEKEGDLYHRARVTLQRLSGDLSASLLIPGVEFIGTSEEIGSQQADSLLFASSAHLLFNRETQKPGLGVIGYHLSADPEDERILRLHRSDRLYLPGFDFEQELEQGEAFLLSDMLRTVSFSFTNEDGDEVESWDSRKGGTSSETEGKLPVAVTCTLEYWLDLENDIALTFSTSMYLIGNIP